MSLQNLVFEQYQHGFLSTGCVLAFTKGLTTYLACDRVLHDRSFPLFITPSLYVSNLQLISLLRSSQKAVRAWMSY